jgi:hypothetical protein
MDEVLVLTTEGSVVVVFGVFVGEEGADSDVIVFW